MENVLDSRLSDALDVINVLEYQFLQISQVFFVFFIKRQSISLFFKYYSMFLLDLTWDNKIDRQNH